MGLVLVVDDDRMIRHLVTEAFEPTEHEVVATGDADSGMDVVRKQSPDVVLLDIDLPDVSGLEAFDKFKALDPKLPVIYITSSGSSDTAIEAMKLGAFDYLLKPLDVNQLRTLVERAIDIRRLMHVPVSLSHAVAPEDHGDQIVGRSPAMQDVFKSIGRVAPQNVTVLIRGESGTGKELVARAIYLHSDRRDQPFLAVNCAAIPEQLLESELFGHEKGAFTGADHRRIGKFEQCDGGTMFLDEVGDMPPALQSKMLRMLQQKEFQRVGGNQTIQADVRVIAATNRDLEQMVAEGDYREDLLYRLNGYTLSLPPLRERGEDMRLLVEHFLARIAKELNRDIDGVADATFKALSAYQWPGNIRELEGVLRQAVLQSSGTLIVPECLPLTITGGEPRSATPAAASSESVSSTVDRDSLPYNLKTFVESRLNVESLNIYAETLELMERYLLSEILTRTEGNQSQAARLLGITRGSLRHKIRSLGIRIESRIGSKDL